ncbi:hypothetical protein ACLOJK_023215 [Asimina triloba]
MATIRLSPRGQANGGSDPSKTTAAGRRCGMAIEARRGTARQRPLHLPCRQSTIVISSSDRHLSQIQRRNRQDPIFVTNRNEPDLKKLVSMLAAIVFFIDAIRPLIYVASCRRRSAAKSAAIDSSSPSRPSPTLAEGGRPAGGSTANPTTSCRGELMN